MKAATPKGSEAVLMPKFQSTPPVKAATIVYLNISSPVEISIHAAREGGDKQQDNPPTVLSISIHAAREGGDRNASRMNAAAPDFNPRRP